ncbi:exopolysaccharide biosynthesis polyprenyl glycosylphosphotransferase [Kineothrix alysoides]|uniref:Exopolysaccharide biosynthesis polyprenyl glycosylphosphotransferase n=1 Tax=Kineothrix alysoides TaxID=1469948 RepID=A0A4R1R2A8_9FIRM|nr:exopolysaccharide biosynthesis polyprenyl glycosylphosphotransferase [Kineothrix alysoides]TCL59458.1 exopolysaccharide biosynthesis polyprenyl glycosylphosphotransferase [Kineothrix alysoides]
MKRLESMKRIIILQLSLLGLCLQTAVYAYFWFESYYPLVLLKLKFYINGHILIIGIYFVLLFFFTNTYGGLKIGYLKHSEVFFSQIFSFLAVNVISYFQISLMRNWLAPIGPMLQVTAIQFVISGVWTYFCNTFYRSVFPPREMLLVYGERSIDDIMSKFATRKDKFNIVKCMNISEGVTAIEEEAVKRYDAVVLWDISTQERNKLLKFFYGRSIRVYMMPKITDVLIQGSEQLHFFDTPIFLTKEYSLTVEQRAVKRLIDIVCSLLLIIITSPIMLVAALIIKLYDNGPVLYKQVRCTRDQEEFYIMKFRSMRVDAEKDGVARLAAKNDSRITPIGKFIRAVRIDELPQLFNILKGEMSFIGPRPERPEIIAQYVEEMPEFLYRMKVKAGLAGYAQVYGKYNTTPYDKLKLDLAYIENYTVWLDMKLMLLTLKILFRAESTEGVDSKQITALRQEEDK